jgi:hypothetical protein
MLYLILKEYLRRNNKMDIYTYSIHEAAKQVARQMDEAILKEILYGAREVAGEPETEVAVTKLDLDRVIAHTMLGFVGNEKPIEMAEKISDAVLEYLEELGVAVPQDEEECEDCEENEVCCKF